MERRILNTFLCFWIRIRSPLPHTSSQHHPLSFLSLQKRTRVLSLSSDSLLRSSNSAAHPLLHPPPSATISPTPPNPPHPPRGIDGLLLTVHTAACSCSDQGQPNVGRKQEEHRGGEERGDDYAGSSLAFFCLTVSVTTGLISDRLALGKVTVREVSPPNRRPADEPTYVSGADRTGDFYLFQLVTSSLLLCHVCLRYGSL